MTAGPLIRIALLAVVAPFGALSANMACAQLEGWTLSGATVNVPLHASAGTAKAGMLCFPSGRLQVSDFVESGAVFAEQAEAAFRSANVSQAGQVAARTGELKITLEGITASLCARGYGTFGLGNRKAMSGRVDFHFSISMGRPTASHPTNRQEIVRVEVPKGATKPTEALLAEALPVLMARALALPDD